MLILLTTGCTKRYGLASGEPVRISSPPSRSQMSVTAKPSRARSQTQSTNNHAMIPLAPP